MFADSQRQPPEADEGADYRRLSNREFLLIFGGAVVIFGVFIGIGQSGRGFIAALAFCAVAGTAGIMQPLSNRLGYWITLTAVALAHVLLIAAVKWPEIRGPGIVLSPLVIVDIYVSARLIRFFAGNH